MPIVINDFIWNQNADQIYIKVPSRGISPNKIDVSISSQYIKASFGPFLFDAILLEPVNVSYCTCIKSMSYILFELKKYSSNFWTSLEINNISKEEKRALRRKCIQEEHRRIQNQCEVKFNKEAELKRIAIRKQMQLDATLRDKIEQTKRDEKNSSLGDIDEWQKNIDVAEERIENKEFDGSINFLEPLQIKGGNVSEKLIRKAQNLETTKFPKLRDIRCVQILFTSREFVTPSRESRLPEENEYLLKQAAARRSVGFFDEDLRPEERNPNNLLAKGKEFIKSKNYFGAISAFTFGIKLSPKFVDLYLARSEVHLIVGNYKRTVEDCTEAISLLKPCLPLNLHDRAVCIGRRGVALFKLGFFRQGLSELHASVQMEENDYFTDELKKCQRIYHDFQLNKDKDMNVNSVTQSNDSDLNTY